MRRTPGHESHTWTPTRRQDPPPCPPFLAERTNAFLCARSLRGPGDYPQCLQTTIQIIYSALIFCHTFRILLGLSSPKTQNPEFSRDKKFWALGCPSQRREFRAPRVSGQIWRAFWVLAHDPQTIADGSGRSVLTCNKRATSVRTRATTSDGHESQNRARGPVSMHIRPDHDTRRNAHAVGPPAIDALSSAQRASRPARTMPGHQTRTGASQASCATATPASWGRWLTRARARGGLAPGESTALVRS